MKILTYIHPLRLIHNSTGAGRAARQLTEHLAEEPTDEIHILADRSDYNQVIDKVGSPWTNFAYHFLHSKTSWQQARWLFTHNPPVEQYWSEAEIVYCPVDSYVPTQKARLVVNLFDVSYLEENAHPKNWLYYRQQLKYKYLYNVLSRKADLLTTISHFSAERLAHFFPSLASRIRVVSCAVSPRFFLPPSEEGKFFLKQLKLDQQPFILLARGLSYRKNAHLVLESWPELHLRYPDLKLVISSVCDPYYADKAKTLGDSVILTGFVSDEALCSLYYAAEVVWFPSLYEGFGLPVLESMACNTPVVVSDSSSLPEIAGDAALIASTKSATEHIEAIDSILKNPNLKADLTRRGQRHAQKFTWQRSVITLRKVFKSVL